MSYIVPMDIPKYCDKCPFGMCVYSSPFWVKPTINPIDMQDDYPNTQGYVCDLELYEKGKYESVNRAFMDSNVEKPDWCPLLDLSNADIKIRR